MTTPKYKKCVKKCEDFSICSIRCDKGWVGIEPVQENYGLYHYCVYGSGKFAVPFQNYKEINPKDFFNMKEYLNDHVMLEASEDFYWIGFNTLDKDQDWNGKLVTDDITTFEKESWMICFDGHPIVNNKELSRFDYARLYPNKSYDINLNEGTLAAFTKC